MRFDRRVAQHLEQTHAVDGAGRTGDRNDQPRGLSHVEIIVP